MEEQSLGGATSDVGAGNAILVRVCHVGMRLKYQVNCPSSARPCQIRFTNETMDNLARYTRRFICHFEELKVVEGH